MNLLKNIGQFGVSKNCTIQQKRAVIITNYLSLILSGLILVLLTYRLIFTDNTLVYLYLLGSVIFLIPLCLNKFKQTMLGEFLICVLPVWFLWYAFTLVVDENPLAILGVSVYDGIRIYLLAFGVIPYLILDRTKPSYVLINVMPVLISILFFDKIVSVTNLKYIQQELINEDYKLMMIRTLISYLLISSGCLVLQYIIYLDDKFNRKLVHDLKNKNTALIKFQEELNSINQNLESIVENKTQTLKLKNEALVKYAYANAHHVRGPIARILGLIQISKLDKNVDLKWFFEKVKNETENVDNILRNISKELDEIEREREIIN